MANKKNDKIDLNISDSSIEIDKNNQSIEKITKILKQVKYQFDSTIDNKDLLRNLNWVIKKLKLIPYILQIILKLRTILKKTKKKIDF